DQRIVQATPHVDEFAFEVVAVAGEAGAFEVRGFGGSVGGEAVAAERCAAGTGDDAGGSEVILMPTPNACSLRCARLPLIRSRASLRCAALRRRWEGSRFAVALGLTVTRSHPIMPLCGVLPS